MPSYSSEPKRLYWMALTVLCAAMSACSDEDDHVTAAHRTGDGDEAISSVTIEANRFVRDVMSDYYYWEAEMPSLDYKKQSDTEEYFYSLLSSKDRFSYISSDAQATIDGFEGKYTDFGWEYKLSYLSSTSDSVVAIVTYVYDATPASAAGVRRGDVVYAVDGKAINSDNYRTLFVNAASGSFAAYRVENGNLAKVSYSMAAADITENPVALSRIIDNADGSKVGYLFYTSFSYTFNDDLVAAFKSFADGGVSDVVLDLRYNPGGDLEALSYMCSMLAPKSAVDNKDEMLFYDFNDKLKTLASYSRDSSSVHFSDEPGVNLDLSRLVVLVGPDTYSASEATIWSLMPYSDVTLIGDTTGGKNSMMYVMSPEDFTYASSGMPYYSSSINNWLIMPIVAIYKNTTGQAFDTSLGYGLPPTYYVPDLASVLTKGLKPIGDPDENLLAASLSYLSTGSVSTNKNLQLPEALRSFGSSADSKPQVLYRRLVKR